MSPISSYVPVIAMLIGLSCLVAILVLFLRRMRRDILEKMRPALSIAK